MTEKQRCFLYAIESRPEVFTKRILSRLQNSEHLAAQGRRDIATLSRMIARGWVAPVVEMQRVSYRITDAGRDALAVQRENARKFGPGRFR